MRGSAEGRFVSGNSVPHYFLGPETVAVEIEVLLWGALGLMRRMARVKAHRSDQGEMSAHCLLNRDFASEAAVVVDLGFEVGLEEAVD